MDRTNTVYLNDSEAISVIFLQEARAAKNLNLQQTALRGLEDLKFLNEERTALIAFAGRVRRLAS